MSNKHLPHDLKQLQSLPLEAKIIMTQQRIRQWHEYWDGMVYVSVAGIDSTVLKHIIDGLYDDVPALFVNTGLEYPEIQSFWKGVQKEKYKCFNPDVNIVRPEIPFHEVLKRYGYPVFSKEAALNIEYGRKAMARGDEERVQRYLYGKRKNPNTGEIYNHMGLSKKALDFALNSDIPVSNICCSVMKKQPAKKYAKETGRRSIQGTQAAESKLRESHWIKSGCNAFNTKEPVSRPLSFWTKQDVLHYAKMFNIPYPSVYGDIVIDDGDDNQINLIDYLDDYEPEDKLKTTGCARTGCIFCMFGCHLEKEPNRFQRLKETHPKQYKYCIGGGEMIDGKWQPSKEGLGLGKVLDFIGVKYD